MHQNCTPTKTGKDGGRAKTPNGKSQLWCNALACNRAQHRLHIDSHSCLCNHVSHYCIAGTDNPPNSRLRKRKKLERGGGSKEFIGSSSHLVKKPIQVTPRNLHHLLTHPPLFTYTNRSLLLHPVLKCLSIYSLLPGLLKKNNKNKKGGAAKKQKRNWAT